MVLRSPILATLQHAWIEVPVYPFSQPTKLPKDDKPPWVDISLSIIQLDPGLILKIRYPILIFDINRQVPRALVDPLVNISHKTQINLLTPDNQVHIPIFDIDRPSDTGIFLILTPVNYAAVNPACTIDRYISNDHIIFNVIDHETKLSIPADNPQGITPNYPNRLFVILLVILFCDLPAYSIFDGLWLNLIHKLVLDQLLNPRDLFNLGFLFFENLENIICQLPLAGVSIPLNQI